MNSNLHQEHLQTGFKKNVFRLGVILMLQIVIVIFQRLEMILFKSQLEGPMAWPDGSHLSHRFVAQFEVLTIAVPIFIQYVLVPLAIVIATNTFSSKSWNSIHAILLSVFLAVFAWINAFFAMNLLEPLEL